MSLQPNKILGAVLAVAVVAFAIDFVSNQIFAKQELKVPGYVVEVTEPVAEAAPAASALVTRQAEGPRHVAFHPDGRRAYVVTELRSSLITCDWDADRGVLVELCHECLHCCCTRPAWRRAPAL